MTARGDPPGMKPSLLLLPLVLLALGACNSNRQATGETSSLGFPAPDQELVYHTALSVLARYGHSPDMEQSSTTTGTSTSRRMKGGRSCFARRATG